MSEILLVVAGLEAGSVPDLVEPHWVRSIPEVSATGWPWSVRTVAYELGSGVDAQTEPVPIRTWEIMSAVADASIVHICGPYTPAGEVAVLAARIQGKPLVVSDLARSTSRLGKSFGLLDLADAILCEGPSDAADFAGRQGVEIVDFAQDTWPSQLGAIYGQLLAPSRAQA